MTNLLTFCVTCVSCGELLDLVVVGPDESWGPAVQWGYVAQQQHASECRAEGDR